MKTKTKKYYLVKRGIDFSLSLVLFIALAPLVILISFLIKITSPGPVIFKQQRLGRHARLFDIYKFRTMIDGAARIGSQLKTAEGDLRITDVGVVLRRFSLDELPQLVNIIKGEMSFIGPRPVPEIHASRYDVKNPKRLSLRPGITGWAQVSGRNELDWPEKIQKDIEYADNISFLLDLNILIKTLHYIVFGKSLYSKKFVEEVENHNQTIRSRTGTDQENRHDPKRQNRYPETH